LERGQNFERVPLGLVTERRSEREMRERLEGVEKRVKGER